MSQSGYRIRIEGWIPVDPTDPGQHAKVLDAILVAAEHGPSGADPILAMVKPDAFDVLLVGWRAPA